MYHHWLKQRALQGRCADMGGFTLTLTLTLTLNLSPTLALALALTRCGDMGTLYLRMSPYISPISRLYLPGAATWAASRACVRPREARPTHIGRYREM